jgi:UDP-N-acetylglucosamine acyltransferase
MNKIHPTATVSSKAELGNNITIGPYTYIEDDVKIDDDVHIGPYVGIYNGARIGKRVKIHQSASVSSIPQDLKFEDEKSEFFIGDDCQIREYVTLNRGTKATGSSSIGKNCLLMTCAHVGHDSTLGDNCILANAVAIGGHVTVGNWVIIGGLTPVHQFCKIGEHAMIGGGFRAVNDVPPYILAGSEPLKYAGLNLIGLRRRGFSNDEIQSIKAAYTIFYRSGLNHSDAVKKLKDDFSPEDKYVSSIISFIENSDRGLIKG